MVLYLFATLFVLQNIPITPSETSFGTYCGMCDGTCAPMFTLDKSIISLDTTSFFPAKWSDKEYNFEKHKVRELKDYHKKDLPFSVPLIMLLDPKEWIGCPDCYDQCGRFLSIKVGPITRQHYIDTRVSPWYAPDLNNRLSIVTSWASEYLNE